uniref:ER-bound oxygenase mpaB/mpaB'/Rubber oxygenase catalytic domain-containing protein n=1 Tax=Mycena chlorophos TaxID=658473 RepID=A0ABQ0LGF1_MYCCL|nr:predicted protein [Mycena chlorophos]
MSPLTLILTERLTFLLHLASTRRWTLLASLAGAYLLLVRTLRWRRLDALHAKYAKKRCGSDSEEWDLTPAEAQDILQLALAHDMPTLSEASLAFALFKTYAIPTISELLLKTRQLSTPETMARRYADATATWLACPITGRTIDAPPLPADSKTNGDDLDPRAVLAIARVNWLHGKYKISNEDFLYTLGLFMFEPAKFAARYSWRAHAPLEQHAAFVYWSEVGRKMGIEDIPETAQGFKDWIEEYEQLRMVPAESNRDLAQCTTDELLFAVPRIFGIRAFAEGLVRAVLDDRTRVAMMQPRPPFYAPIVIDTLMGTLALVHRWMTLPRFKSWAFVPSKMPQLVPLTKIAPRMNPAKWASLPWYKPTPRSPLGRLQDRLLVLLGYYQDVPKVEYRSAGYRLHELGPQRYEREGHEDVMRMAGEMQGCPVAAAWSAGRAKEVDQRVDGN